MADRTNPESEGTALETGASVWDDSWTVEAHITDGLNANGTVRHWLKKNGLSIVVEDSQNTKFGSPERAVYAVNAEGLRAKLYYVLEQSEDMSVEQVVNDICRDIDVHTRRVFRLGSPSFPKKKGDTSYPDYAEVNSWYTPPTCATDALRVNGQSLPYPIIPSLEQVNKDNGSPELTHFFYKKGYDPASIRTGLITLSNPVRVNGNYRRNEWLKEVKKARQEIRKIEKDNLIIGVINRDGEYSHVENQWNPTWGLEIYYVPKQKADESSDEISQDSQEFIQNSNVINSVKGAIFLDKSIDAQKVSFEMPKGQEVKLLENISLPCRTNGLIDENSFYSYEALQQLKSFLGEYSHLYLEVEVSEQKNALVRIYVSKDEFDQNRDSGVGGAA